MVETRAQKRRREYADALEETKRTRRVEIETLERLVKVLPDAAMIVMYRLPYPTIRNFCAVSKAIATFCGEFLGDAFWRAAWLSDRRAFTRDEHAIIDFRASLLLESWDLDDELWDTLHLPDEARTEKFVRDVARSPRAHIWVRYEAALLSPELNELMLLRLGGTWRRRDSAFGEDEDDSEIRVALLSDAKNGIAGGAAWWDDLDGEDLIIVSRLNARFQYFQTVGLEPRHVAKRKEESYPVIDLPYVGEVQGKIDEDNLTSSEIMEKATDPYRHDVPRAQRKIQENVPSFHPSDPDGASAEHINPDDPAYEELLIEKMTRQILGTDSGGRRGIRVVVFAVPTAKTSLIGGYKGRGSMRVVRKKDVVVLFDGKDYWTHLFVEKGDPARFTRWGAEEGDPAVLRRRFLGTYVANGSEPDDRTTASRLQVLLSVVVELVRNDLPRSLAVRMKRPMYDVTPGTYQIEIDKLGWTVPAFRAHVLTDRVLQDHFVDPEDRAARHRSALRFGDVARVPRDEDARRYLLRRIEPAGGERPYEVIWDRRTGFPFCHHRGLPVGAFADRFRTEREPSLCPDNACSRARVPSSWK